MRWLHGQNTIIVMPAPWSGRGRTTRCGSGLQNTHREFRSSFVSRTTRFLFHSQAIHVGSRLGAQTEATAAETTRRGSRGREAPDARGSQLRSRLRRIFMASRFPPRIAQGAHSWRPVAAADRTLASSMTTRDCAATSSGTSPRRRRIWCTASPRRSRNAGCRVRS